jgi:hypothetical protein
VINATDRKVESGFFLSQTLFVKPENSYCATGWSVTSNDRVVAVEINRRPRYIADWRSMPNEMNNHGLMKMQVFNEIEVCLLI